MYNKFCSDRDCTHLIVASFLACFKEKPAFCKTPQGQTRQKNLFSENWVNVSVFYTIIKYRMTMSRLY
ncbi:hypothetical protein EVA_11460 [gut metagenome]|uniref:Uncharacterized protein n=1 Tax=gut metagenome TaxID=749906 RepID=J9G0S5_9ZZZZ